ncbi:MAG: hypothetical protein ACI81R_000618 [Bradymonadia bacterium]
MITGTSTVSFTLSLRITRDDTFAGILFDNAKNPLTNPLQRSGTALEEAVPKFASRPTPLLPTRAAFHKKQARRTTIGLLLVHRL